MVDYANGVDPVSGGKGTKKTAAGKVRHRFSVDFMQ